MTATTSKLGADMDELINLLREIRPSFSDVGSRDVDTRRKQNQIDRAIELLARQPAAIDKALADADPATNDYPDTFTLEQIQAMDKIIPQGDREFVGLKDYQALANEFAALSQKESGE